MTVFPSEPTPRLGPPQASLYRFAGKGLKHGSGIMREHTTRLQHIPYCSRSLWMPRRRLPRACLDRLEHYTISNEHEATENMCQVAQVTEGRHETLGFEWK
jgi:hypothetical protein